MQRLTMGLVVATCLVCLVGAAVGETFIDNGYPVGDPRRLEVGVDKGGAAKTAKFGGEDWLYVYRFYLDTGSPGGTGGIYGAYEQSGAPELIAPNKVRSTGSFTGTDGNTVEFTVTSWIKPHSSAMTTQIEFQCEGAIGDLAVLGVLDLDIPPYTLPPAQGNDIVIPYGSPDTDNLTLWTVDASGMLGTAQTASAEALGAELTGWGVGCYRPVGDPMEEWSTENLLQHYGLDPSIQGWADPFLARETVPFDGTTYGPDDMLTYVAFTVNPEANRAVVSFGMGGPPDVYQVIPEPVTMILFASGAVLVLERKRLSRRERSG